MTEESTEVNLFKWRHPTSAALIAFAVLISVAVCQADTAFFLYLSLVGPILVVISIAMLIYTIIGKGRRKRLTLLSTLATVWVVSAVVFVYHV